MFNTGKQKIKKRAGLLLERQKEKNIHKSISNPAKISIPYRQRNTRKIVRQIVAERNNMEIRARP